MKFCPRCGSDLVPGANFCYSCGYNLSIVQEDEDEDQPLEDEVKPVSQPSVILEVASEAPVTEEEIPDIVEPVDDIQPEHVELPLAADDLPDEPEEEIEPVVDADRKVEVEPEEITTTADDLKVEPEIEVESLAPAEPEFEPEVEPEAITVKDVIPDPVIKIPDATSILEEKTIPSPGPYLPPAAKPISPDWRTSIPAPNMQQESGESFSEPLITPSSIPADTGWHTPYKNQGIEKETEKSTPEPYAPPAAKPLAPDWRAPYQSQNPVQESVPVIPVPIAPPTTNQPADGQTPSWRPPAHQKPVTESYSGKETGNVSLIKRVIGLITHPVQEWEHIEQETPDRRKLITGYALILALIPAVVTFISYYFFLKDISFYYALTSSILRFLVPFGVLVLATYVSEYLAPSLDSEKNFNRSFQLICYAFTPVWVFFIIGLYPVIRFLAILIGFGYMWYILYKGIPAIKKTPPDKALGYSILMILAIYFSYLIAFKVLEAVLL
ncbi:MAG: YIP1 family protein [Bacteroidetes bacterium]|nr:YIP1 family protein [Bacteroidota bacterium]